MTKNSEKVEKECYSRLYDIVEQNNDSELLFTKEQFLDEIGKAPEELNGLKGSIIYLMLQISKNRQIQSIIKRMPTWMLSIGRKIVG